MPSDRIGSLLREHGFYPSEFDDSFIHKPSGLVIRGCDVYESKDPSHLIEKLREILFKKDLPRYRVYRKKK